MINRKSSVFFAVALLAMASAHATGNHNQPTKAPNAVSPTFNTASIAGAKSAAQARANAAAIAMGGVGVGGAGGASTANAIGGAGGVGGLGGAGGAGGVGGAGGLGGAVSGVAGGAASIEGATVEGVTVTGGANNYRAAAATAYAPAPSGPARSCRLFAGIGGTSTGGSLSGGIPIGNDQTCLSDVAMGNMDRINSLKAGTFTPDDYLKVACKVEGMSELPACSKQPE